MSRDRTGEPARTTAGSPGTADGRQRRYRRLRLFNAVVGLVFVVQVVVVLLLSSDLSLPVTASYLQDDPVAVREPTVPEEAFTLAVGPMVAVFLALAAADHLLVAAPGVHRWYESLLDRRENYVRWVEYAVSASIMIVLIGMLSGIRDLAALMGAFGLTSAMILFGLLMERQQRPGGADWSAFWFGSLVGAVPWVAVAVYVAGAPTVPGFVYAIVVIEAVLFFSFAVNMALQYLQVGRWHDYVVGEVAFVMLSLSAKSLLAWLVFANVLRA